MSFYHKTVSRVTKMLTRTFTKCMYYNLKFVLSNCLEKISYFIMFCSFKITLLCNVYLFKFFVVYKTLFQYLNEVVEHPDLLRFLVQCSDQNLWTLGFEHNSSILLASVAGPEVPDKLRPGTWMATGMVCPKTVFLAPTLARWTISFLSPSCIPFSPAIA